MQNDLALEKAQYNCPKVVPSQENAASNLQTDENRHPFSGRETAENMKQIFSHQISADLQRCLLGEFAIFGNLVKEKLLPVA